MIVKQKKQQKAKKKSGRRINKNRNTSLPMQLVVDLFVIFFVVVWFVTFLMIRWLRINTYAIRFIATECDYYVDHNGGLFSYYIIFQFDWFSLCSIFCFIRFVSFPLRFVLFFFSNLFLIMNAFGFQYKKSMHLDSYK